MATSPFDIVGKSSYGLSAIPNVGQIAAGQRTPLPALSALTNPYKGGSGKAGKVNDGLPTWQTALGYLSSLSRPFTSQTANWTDGTLDWKDNPFAAQSYNFKTAFNKTAEQLIQQTGAANGASTTDILKNMFIPGQGVEVLGTFMNNYQTQAPDFQQTLKNLGVRNNEGLFWGGLAGDIALDPTTYLTLGGSSVFKAGAAAAKGAAKGAVKEAAQVLGKDYAKGLTRVPTSKVADAIADRFYNKALDTYTGAGNAVKADVVRSTARQYYQGIIDDAAKVRRSKAQNAAVNIDIPFTNTTFQIGKLPAALSKNSPEIKRAGQVALQNTLDRAGLTGSVGKQFVEKAVGKSDLSKVTFQEYQFLKGEISRYAKQTEGRGPVNPFTPMKLNDFENTMADTIRAGGTVESVSKIGQDAMRAGTDVDFSKVMDSIQNGGMRFTANTDPLDGFNMRRFVPDMGGTSRIGERILDATNALNPRRVGNRFSGGLVNNVGNQIQNTFGQLRNTSRDLDRVAKALKPLEDLNQAEARLVEYTLEGASDEGLRAIAQMGMDVDTSKVADAVNALRNGMDGTPVESYGQIAKAEQNVDMLGKTRSNYAPHILANNELGSDLISKYADDPDLQQLFKIAPGNKFNQARTSFQSFEQLDSFVSNLRKQAASETDSVRSLELSQKADEISALFERNPVKAYKKRLYASYRTRTLGALYQQLKTDSLIIEPEQIAKLGDAASEYVRLDPLESKKLGLPAGSMMHKDVRKGLLEADKLFNNEGLNKFLENYTSVNNMWKSITTSYRPVHHINNMIGNMFNNTLAGVNPNDYRRATATLNRMFRGKPKQEDLDLMSEIAEHALFGQAHSEEYRRLFGNQANASMLRKTEKLITDNAYINFIRKWLGDSTDNWSRMAHYIHVRRASGTPEQAAESVRKYLFAYGENTSADRMIRLAIPFWTWTKNNIPLQVEQIMKQPRYYQTWIRMQEASYESAGEKREDQEGFIRDDYWRTPWETYRNPRAPMSDLNHLDDPLKLFVSGSTPAIKIPFELATNTSTFTGKPIDYSLERGGPRDPQATLEYGLSQAPVFNDIYKLATGKSSILDVLFGKELEPKK